MKHLKIFEEFETLDWNIDPIIDNLKNHLIKILSENGIEVNTKSGFFYYRIRRKQSICLLELISNQYDLDDINNLYLKVNRIDAYKELLPKNTKQLIEFIRDVILSYTDREFEANRYAYIEISKIHEIIRDINTKDFEMMLAAKDFNL